jgi:hypothetical protein
MYRTITPEETEELFNLCEKYGVFFYDVQIELVDHMASLIEEQWEKDPEISFQQGLKNAVSSFGKSNFTKVTREKEKEVNRKYNLLLWKYFIEFYKWPKLLITIVFTLGLLLFFEFFNQTKTIMLIYWGLVLVGFAFYLIRIFPKYKIKGKSGELFLLTARQSQVMYISIILLQVPLITNNVFKLNEIDSINNVFILAAISFFIVFFSILLYANTFFLSKKIKEHFEEQFPEFAK